MVPKPKKKETEAYKWRFSEEKNSVKVVKLSKDLRDFRFGNCITFFQSILQSVVFYYLVFAVRFVLYKFLLLIKSKRTLLWNFYSLRFTCTLHRHFHIKRLRSLLSFQILTLLDNFTLFSQFSVSHAMKVFGGQCNDRHEPLKFPLSTSASTSTSSRRI